MPASARAVSLAVLAAQAAADKLASHIVVLDVSEQLVICSLTASTTMWLASLSAAA